MKELTKAEIDVLRNALYMHREYTRSIERIAREKALKVPGGGADVEGLRYGITFSLRLDDKLSEMRQEAK